MRPGTIYHVSSHAVANTPLFETPRDHLIFLSLLAEQCRKRELLVHAFCLMTNHFHLQLEDRRGQISQAMSLLKSLYARYYNSTRVSGRRRGALWSSRFHSSVITTQNYFNSSAAYIHLNPMRTKVRMASSPERYAWSSCAMTAVEGVTPADVFRQHVEQEGGIDAILSSMPMPSTKTSMENRRRRFEILLSGTEFAVEGVLGDRSRPEYLAELSAKVGVAKEQMLNARKSDHNALNRVEKTRTETMKPERATTASKLPTSNRPVDGLPRLMPAFDGLTSQNTADRILKIVVEWLPCGKPRRRELRDLEIWAFWRFTSHSIRKLASLVGTSTGEVERALRRVRIRRVNEHAWWRSTWNVEWSLCWSLAAAPWRD